MKEYKVRYEGVMKIAAFLDVDRQRRRRPPVEKSSWRRRRSTLDLTRKET